MSANAPGKYAVIENGVVINLVLWDGNTSQWQPPQGCTCAPVPDDVHVTVGTLYKNKTFTTPPELTAPHPYESL